MEQNPRDGLIIDPPNELRFVGPFTHPVVTIMKLVNPTEHTILFKIKTTAPKRYCVRPNFGSVSPNSFTRVEICLQPFVYDANEKNKHKFMVQSLVSYDDETDITQQWKDAEPHKLMDAKLKCVFEMPEGSSDDVTSGQSRFKGKPAPFPDISKAMTSEKQFDDEKVTTLESDQADSVTAELRQLRDEIGGLRKENMNLREQVMRLRCTPPKKLIMDEPYTQIVAEKQSPMFYIAISIAAAIFGLLLGKYLL